MVKANIKFSEPNESFWQKENILIRDTKSDKLISCDVFSTINSKTTNSNAQLYRLKFSTQTKAYKPVILGIALFSNSACEAQLYINGSNIDSLNLLALDNANEEITKEKISYLKKDISIWTEKKFETEFELRFFLKNDQKVFVVFSSDDEEMNPKVTQSWDTFYSTNALLFFILFNLIIFGFGIVIASHTNGLNSTLGFFAIIISTVVYISGVLGLTDLFKIPYQQKIRLLYSLTYKKRTIWISLLILIFSFTYTFVGFIGYSMVKRKQYSDLIEKAISNENDPTPLIEALAQEPWQKEAQFLTERYVRIKRRTDMNDYRSFIRFLISNPKIIEAIKSIKDKNSLPVYLVNDEATRNDPRVWFASLIAESKKGEADESVLEAINILANIDGTDAIVQRLYFDQYLLTQKINKNINLDESQKKFIENTKQLESIVEDMDKPENSAAKSSYFYQLACDIVATSYTKICDFGVPDCTEKIFYYYNKEIFARKDQLDRNPNIPIWIRPPDKLMLYQLFALEADFIPDPRRSNDGENHAKVEKENIEYFYCEELRKKGQHCPSNPIRELIINDKTEFLVFSKWLNCTSSGENVKEQIQKSLLNKEGWRY
jgi:hypothetical protein